MPLEVGNEEVSLEQFVRVARWREQVILSNAALQRAAASREALERLLRTGTPVYGVSTGVGGQASYVVHEEEQAQLQLNLIRSHMAGVGEPLPEEIVRGALLARLLSLSKGYSGVRAELLKALEALLNHGIVAVVPCYGSLGASGDLAPGAHLAAVLLGEGEVFYRGRRLPAGEALREAGLTPLSLQNKEGLALINGTHFTTSCAALATYDALQLIKAADALLSLSLEAIGGSPEPFDPLHHVVRPLEGQDVVMANVRKLVKGSERLGRRGVQDPYSIRCAPQVHGAVRQAHRFIREAVEQELNSCSDNPLIVEGRALHGGGFHAQHLAQAMDLLCISLNELAVISRARTKLLLTPAISGLPPYLSERPGLETGYMMAEYTAVSLLAELRLLASPSCVDYVSVSGNQEDHASLGMTAALKARRAVGLASLVLGAELACALRALDYVTEPLGIGTSLLRTELRRRLPLDRADHSLQPEIEAAAQLLASGELLEILNRAQLGLE
ncbi:MAG: histidine ammonia-lyase [Nitrososphaerota archaeon]